ncbi:MAG: hypothetical protein J5494_01875, partial [Candidatus Methanomethylophilaceae archaeon]|nr:hypothetical protein [Candidatus Methanomethylophilaceae archaeon]
MYGLAKCGACGRPRIIDLSKTTSRCPYCGDASDNSRLAVYFTSAVQSEVREALAQSQGFVPPDSGEKRRRIELSDPESTLIYRYERCSDPEVKMSILAEGLSELKGTFTMDDVRRIAGDKAEKMVSAMLDRCLIYESRPGYYKARSAARDVVSVFALELQHLADDPGKPDVHIAVEIERRYDQHQNLARVINDLPSELPALEDHGEQEIERDQGDEPLK